jgi:hypothetical protein
MHANKLVDNTEGKKPPDNHTSKYKDNIKVDVNIASVQDQNTVSWKILSDRVKDLQLPSEAGDCLQLKG